MMTVMKDSQEGQPECEHLCTKGNSCISGVTFRLGSLSVAFTHWEVVCRVGENQHQLAHQYSPNITGILEWSIYGLMRGGHL